MSSENWPGTTSTFTATSADIERGAARYLFAIATLSSEQDDRVSTGELRAHLDVAPASVTEMVSKLDDRGLVDYEKYRGATLTDRGESLALCVAWRFCVVSSFFDSVLETDLDEETALDVGFVLPRRGVLRLRDLVSGPCHDRCPESDRDVDECVG